MDNTIFVDINGKRFEAGNGDYSLTGFGTPISVTKETAKEMAEWIQGGRRIITTTNYPKCPECYTTGEEHWEYCPYDGSKMIQPETTHSQHEVKGNSDK
jgi:hypothetical protein